MLFSFDKVSITPQKSHTFLSSDRVSTRLLVGVITGLCMIGCMSERRGYTRNDLSWSWLDKEASGQHLLRLSSLTGTQPSMCWQEMSSQSKLLDTIEIHEINLYAIGAQ